MSGYHYYSFHFVMRPGTRAAYGVLAQVAAGQAPSEASLAGVHPAPRHYLADVRRLLDDEDEPRLGAPVRLAASNARTSTRLSLEFCLHDDEFANGGYLFWLWALSLVEPADEANDRVIGYHGLYRNDRGMGLVVATDQGVRQRDDAVIPYEVIQEQLAQTADGESWPP